MILVVADTGPVHYLVLIDAIDVLPRLYDRLVLPQAVLAELTHPNAPERVRRWADNHPPWVTSQEPRSITPFERLGPGEVEAISLALELKPAALLLDELEARQEAIRLGLPVSGTIGVIEKAAGQGLLVLKEAFDRLLETNFRIAPELIRDAIARHSSSAKRS